jgi:futalosine hydrolase
MKILIVAATPFEISPLKQYLEKTFIQTEAHRFQKGEIQVALLITGVGLPLTAYALGSVLGTDEWSLVINAGVAGAIDRNLVIGEVVQVGSERFADLGVEEANGQFTDVHQMSLIPADQPPFKEGKLINAGSQQFSFLNTVDAISVNKVHGTEQSIAQLRQKYPDAQIETMEGASFFYACLSHQLAFLEIRSISNYVEPRNRDNWNLPLAIEQLNTTLIDMIKSLFA